MKHQCICNLCNCGKHTCFGDRHIQQIRQLQKQYLSNNPNGIENQNLGNHYRYEDISTTYKDHYQPRKRMKTDYTQFRDIGKQTLANNIAFSGSTNYQDSYSQKYDKNIVDAINPEISLSKPQYIRPNIKFQGQSRYKTDFVDSPYMQRIRFMNSQKTNRNIMSTQKSPFQGGTTYDASYKPYILDIRRQNSNTATKQLATIKFEGISSYKDDYKGFTIREELNGRCPVENLPVPPAIYGKNNRHIYYDSLTKRFV